MMGLFGPNKKALKKWPQLSPEDAELCWKVLKCKSGEEDKYLSVAIEEKRYEVLPAINFAVPFQCFITLAPKAYELKDDRALSLLGKISVYDLNEANLAKLLNALLCLPAWPDGDKLLLSWFGKLDVQNFIKIITRYQEPETIQLLIKQLYVVRPQERAAIVIDTLNSNRTVFDAALEALPIDADTPSVLACAGLARLKTKAITDTHVFNALVAKGMNVNHDKGALLIAALKNNYLPEAQMLINARFNLELLGEHVRETIYNESGHPDAVEFIERYVGKRSKPIASDDNGFVLTAPDTVVRSVALPDGGSLTVAFNFTLQQQITIAQMSGQVSAPMSVSFNQLDNPALLQRVAAAFVAAGGDVALSAIDSNPVKFVLGKAPIKAGG